MKRKALTLLFHFLLFPFFLLAEPFIEGELTGQLGNQFFIIATTVSLALDNGAIPVFPDLEQKDEYNIPLNREVVFSHLNAERLGRFRYLHIEPHFQYAKIRYVPNMKIRGFFQSEKYFAHHKQEIVELFSPSEKIRQYLSNTYSDIIEDPNTVSIHVRFYHEDPEEKFHIGFRKGFAQKAIALFPKDAHFIIFSNQMEKCKELFADMQGIFRFIEGEPHYHDFYLMSLCKHNIICSSSFSWWAAYLNPNPSKKVIAPRRWFTEQAGLNTEDLIPESWIIIDAEK